MRAPFVGRAEAERHRLDVAHYVADMAGDLAKLAAGAEFGFVAYLLAMAAEDAAATARLLANTEPERPRRSA